VNRALLEHVDVLFGNEQDFASALGFSQVAELERAAPRELLREVIAAYPSVTTIALRSARQGWAASAYHEGEFYEAAQREIAILDRIGAGDAFASGFLYGLLNDKGPAWALDCGLAHRVLAMSTPGDTSMATLDEVLRTMNGASTRVER
jgi:2-dehydro-3-deoxygluconokinase